MTGRGGAREGAGRPPRQEPKSKPIWCGQMPTEDREAILEWLTPTERGKALMDAVREKTKGARIMYGEIYEGEDRVKQVNYLRDLAANIKFGSDDPSTSAQDRIDYYCSEFADELPQWFDDHDKGLLVQWVED